MMTSPRSNADRPPSVLAAYMDEHGITQHALIQSSGLPRGTITAAYHGRPGRLETYITIAKALGVPLRVIAPDHADALDGIRVS